MAESSKMAKKPRTKQSETSTVQCSNSWNANGIKSRISYMKEFINRLDIDILIVNDTRLNERIKIKIKNYTCVRKDNPTKPTGGVMVLIKNNIAYKEVPIDISVMWECIAIRLPNGIHFIGTYNSPSNSIKRNDLDKILATGSKTILVGDLNARHSSWNNSSDNSNGKVVYNYVVKNNCTILYPNEPTHYPTNGRAPSTIDIALIRNIKEISPVTVLHESNSDHNPIKFVLGGQYTSSTTQTRLDYCKADWKLFRECINRNLSINSKIETKGQIEQEVHKLTSKIQNATRKAIPTKEIKTFQNELPLYILQMIKDRNKTRRIWQKHRIDTLKQKMNKQTTEIRKAIRENINSKWEQKLSKLNPKDNSIWKMTRTFKTETQPIPTLIKTDREAMTDNEKAEMLADKFENVHTIDRTNNTVEQTQITNTVIEYLKDETVEGWHSTTQQVTRIVNDIRLGFNKELVTVMLLLDIEKAFDRVWTERLLYKLITKGYPDTLVEFLSSYLSNRHLRVQINAVKSTKRKIGAGVPQGSILGPKLFNAYINDLPTFNKTKIALYADDTAIYTHSYNAIIAAKQIQTHTNILEPYYNKWKIHLNTTKTEAIVFTKKKDRCNKIFQPITVYGQKIITVNTVKYLGVHLDNKLTYRAHFKESVRKAH
ncbi:hypothetical protein KPH14_002065, partial [Odynerus spinipes]